MPKCTQCDKPAIAPYGGHPLCVDHYYKMMQAHHVQMSWLASEYNILEEAISAGTGGIMPPNRLAIPQLPSSGDTTYNNINVEGSTIGAINTGTIANLSASITIMQGQGKDKLAAAVKELTEAVIKSNEINDSIKNEINDQLEFLVTQATVEAKNRQMGTVKSVLSGIKSSISTIAGLLTIWNKVEPLIKAALGIS